KCHEGDPRRGRPRGVDVRLLEEVGDVQVVALLEGHLPRWTRRLLLRSGRLTFDRPAVGSHRLQLALLAGGLLRLALLGRLLLRGSLRRTGLLLRSRRALLLGLLG